MHFKSSKLNRKSLYHISKRKFATELLEQKQKQFGEIKR